MYTCTGAEWFVGASRRVLWDQTVEWSRRKQASWSSSHALYLQRPMRFQRRIPTKLWANMSVLYYIRYVFHISLVLRLCLQHRKSHPKTHSYMYKLTHPLNSVDNQHARLFSWISVYMMFQKKCTKFALQLILTFRHMIAVAAGGGGGHSPPAALSRGRHFEGRKYGILKIGRFWQIDVCIAERVGS